MKKSLLPVGIREVYKSTPTLGQNLINTLRIINKMQWEFIGGRDENPAEQGLFVLINATVSRKMKGKII